MSLDADGATPSDSGATRPDDRPQERTGPVLRVLALATVVSLVGVWGYVCYLAFFEGRQDPVDRLEDPDFAPAAEARCAAALDALGELPVATESPTPEHRAGVLDEANAELGGMLDDLDSLTSGIDDPGERDRARAWLADWQTYLSDREAYAEDLRTDPEARMRVSEKEGEGRHITGWIDEFADANRMESCATPGDA